jgi:putative ABC transport system permease protein
MIKHLLKLVWNRKRANVLLVIEIFFSFLVLFAVVTLGVYYADNYRQPLGFSYENVWNIGVDMKLNTDDEWTPEMVETARQVYLALDGLDEVEAAAGAMYPPYYVMGGSGSVFVLNGRSVQYGFNEVTDDFKDVVGLTLIRGRWFEQADDALNWDPLVINQRLSQEIFGSEDPIGKSMRVDEGERDRRVIGVISDFRQYGEYAGLDNYLFERKRLGDPAHRPPQRFVIKVRPGTTAVFEEKLNQRLQAAAREWSFDITPLTQLRETSLKLFLAPIFAVGLVAVFLMIMVALGLVGVLWQNVTQRTKEIGVRRAQGAAAGHIYFQVLGELLVITSVGLVIGVLVVVQFPLLDLIGFVSTTVYVYSLMISSAVIYLLTILCGLYPSWLATKIQPAEALHYE